MCILKELRNNKLISYLNIICLVNVHVLIFCKKKFCKNTKTNKQWIRSGLHLIKGKYVLQASHIYNEEFAQIVSLMSKQMRQIHH